MPDDYEMVLLHERAINEEYLRILKKWYQGLTDLTTYVAVPQNTMSAGGAPSIQPSARVIGPLIGRVGLDFDDPDLGASFYIGTYYQELSDGTVVVSWAAKVARLLFEGRASAWHNPDPGSLQARRNFEVEQQDLVAYFDELESGVDAATVFSVRREATSIPEPPATVPPRDESPEERPDVDPPPAPRAKSVAPSPPKPQPPAPPLAADGWGDDGRSADDEDGTPRPTDRGAAESEAGEAELDEQGLRNEGLTRRKVTEPKTGYQHSMLSTLQPDQFQLVTFPAANHLAVQGHPGTGKTVVATHRAAWLTHPSGETKLERVALVGPNDAWAHHVRGVLDELGATGVKVVSLEALVAEYADGARHALQLNTERYYQVGWEVARSAARSTRRLRGALTRTRRKNIDLVLDQLVGPTEIHREFVNDAEVSQWLLQASNAATVRREKEYLLLVAVVGQAVDQLGGGDNFKHVIVDEVQDLRGAEWYLLHRLLAQNGRWSLFGDLNQRRANTSYTSWMHIAQALEFEPEDGTEFVPEVLEQGYRSTRQILRYAAALLDRGDRRPKALLEGPEPRVRRVGAKQLVRVVVEEIESMAQRHLEGRLAVITRSPRQFEKGFREQGWSTTHERHVLKKTGMPMLGIFRPAMTRGLEYDGVVVVEPSAFPENLGRRGRLYTALTRANKELVVVHSRALPKELRGRGERVS
ncbi:MAG TPA: hypothetical protein DGN59_05215 [Candidatus Latescibacteria bacterium]|nr:hypothetical protein [Candidatus Latescibacterota bacterium]